MTKMHELAELGQAVWLDYIRRSFITSGELQKLIDQGLRGLTSNPSIFEKAIAHSDDYDESLRRLASQPAEEIFWALAVEDIQDAADLFRPVYERTQGADGYVSLEVNPQLAHDTEKTIEEAQRLWNLVDRPNLMVKIPATKAGIPAITRSIAAGVNVNVTLIFSLARYAEVMAAFIAGLQERAGAGQPVDHIASVASFFVSRVDTKVDKALEEIIRREGKQAGLASSLLGKAAVANARLAYSQFKTVFEGESFSKFRELGARVQRPLWASTSTKNPAYSDILYVQELIGPHTVNTVPQDTLENFIDHGEVDNTLEGDLNQARYVTQMLADLGISMDRVTQELEEEGVAAFAKSFESLIASIAEKREKFLPSSSGPASESRFVETGSTEHGLEAQAAEPRSIRINTTGFESSGVAVEAALQEMDRDRILERIWARDHTVWKPQPEEISNRLGWLEIARSMKKDTDRILAFARDVYQAGYRHALLLGMGGSSLAPDLFGRIFPGGENSLELSVLDSTDPGSVLAHTERLDPNTTLYIVSTKSGTTEETLSLFRYFYEAVSRSLGPAEAGAHFIAITDPGSKLAEMAGRHHFREVFLNDPNLGGRYSALSYFGLVPAALAGVDLERLLDRALEMMDACRPGVPARENPAALLGVLLSENAKLGRDKVTFLLSPTIEGFGDWVEQLIAESTGKEGKGILPVVGEPAGAPALYGNDRLFVQLNLESDPVTETALNTLADSGFPWVRLELRDLYDLGGQFFLWELATAIVGYRLGINPFDQPDVESAKKRAREMVAGYRETGLLVQGSPLLSKDGVAVYGPQKVEGAGLEWGPGLDGPGKALAVFLSQAQPGDYIAIQAFVEPGRQTHAALQDLRLKLRNRYRLATTLGYGPRFLHSTGQLHKGDSGNGLFVQFTYEPGRDAPIPDDARQSEPGSQASSSISFGVLELAQALGDRQALLDAGRRVIRFHITAGVSETIQRLAGIFE